MEKTIVSVCTTLLGSLRVRQGIPAKTVGRAHYYHLVSCGSLKAAETLGTLLARDVSSPFVPGDLVLKDRGEQCCSVLVYPGFFELPHPALAFSCEIDTLQKQVRIRHYRANRPVLHRKELLLEAGSDEHTRCSILTAEEEAAGLLARPFNFGFESQWKTRLATAGFIVSGHSIVACE
ncbi:MAG: hypothetical protein ACLFNQ_01805 [Spirochaetaceae bacterium]